MEEDLRFEGIEANGFLKMMERAGAPLNIVILGGKTFKEDYREGKSIRRLGYLGDRRSVRQTGWGPIGFRQMLQTLCPSSVLGQTVMTLKNICTR